MAKNRLSVVAKYLLQIIPSSDDNLFVTSSAHLLGYLYMVLYSTTHQQTNLPIDYSYLPATSLLPVIFDSSLEAGKLGPHSTWKDEKMECFLNSVISVCEQLQLPPVNWAMLLSPLMRVGYKSTVRYLCLRFAVLNLKTVPGLPLWLSSWLQPGVFIGLDQAAQSLLLHSVGSLVTCLPSSKVQSLLEDLPLQTLKSFNSNDHSNNRSNNSNKMLTTIEEVLNSVLDGWLCVLEMQQPVQSTICFVMSGVKKVLDFWNEHSSLFRKTFTTKLAKCLLLLPGDYSQQLLEQEHMKREFVVGLRLEWLRCGQWSSDKALQLLSDCSQLEGKLLYSVW